MQKLSHVLQKQENPILINALMMLLYFAQYTKRKILERKGYILEVSIIGTTILSRAHLEISYEIRKIDIDCPKS